MALGPVRAFALDGGEEHEENKNRSGFQFFRNQGSNDSVTNLTKTLPKLYQI